MTKKADDQVNQVLGPIRDLNALAVANTEKLVNFQLDVLKRYAEFGIAQMKAVTELKDTNELQDYQVKSTELAKTVADTVRADVEAATQLGTECVADVQKLVQGNLQRVTTKAA